MVQIINCTIQYFKLDSLIIRKLYTSNTFMFITNTPLSAYSICGGNRSEIVLYSVGIIQLTSDCILQIAGFTLIAEQISI